MTLQWIIDTLRLNVVNSKGQVIKALQEANSIELMELRRSINEEINKKMMESENIDKTV
jgi:hypothetical protein